MTCKNISNGACFKSKCTAAPWFHLTWCCDKIVCKPLLTTIASPCITGLPFQPVQKVMPLLLHTTKSIVIVTLSSLQLCTYYFEATMVRIDMNSQRKSEAYQKFNVFLQTRVEIVEDEVFISCTSR